MGGLFEDTLRAPACNRGMLYLSVMGARTSSPRPRGFCIYRIMEEIMDYNQNQVGRPVDETVSIGEWLITLLILAIPLVGIIMMFVWAFGSSKKSKSNFCKATLIWMLIGVIFSIIFGAAIIGTLASFAR